MDAPAAPPSDSLRDRLTVLKKFRHRLAESGDAYVQAVGQHDRRAPGATLSAEVIPLADACRFLERNAARLLKPRKLGWRHRPVWLMGVPAQVRREPFGRVLVIGPGNYPLFLPGAQVLQAIAAGNTVEVKPAPGDGPGGSACMHLLRRDLIAAGLPESRLTVLGESLEAAQEAIDRADLVVATGSFRTGQAILQRCAARATPCILELSGCDAMVVLESADLAAAASAVRFGLSLNASQTCIAPRRVLVAPGVIDRFCAKLQDTLSHLPATPVPTPGLEGLRQLAPRMSAAGATRLSGDGEPTSPMRPMVWRLDQHDASIEGVDVFAPWAVVSPAPPEQAQLVETIHRGGYRLGASVWGERRAAEALARKLDVGSVVINDVVATTADPRLPFEGRGRSGYGPTRGAEGLLAMTRTKAVSTRRLPFRPHLDPPSAAQEDVLRAGLQLSHGRSLPQRLAAIPSLVRAAQRVTKAPANPGELHTGLRQNEAS